MFTNGLNMSLPLRVWVKKTIDAVKTHWLFSKEKVLGAMISKEGHANSPPKCEKGPPLLISLKKLQL